MESGISDHTKVKNKLIPPYLKLTGLFHPSWINERLPEMLWAVLVIANVERYIALEFFRSIADFVCDNHDCFDVTLTGISNFPETKRKEFINVATSWSPEVRSALLPLIIFEDLPARDDWLYCFQTPAIEDIWEDGWNKLFNGVAKTYWHQSDEATDCRWIKLLCMVVAEKMVIPDSIDNTHDLLKSIIEYPNYGDLDKIRPLIRTAEMVRFPPDGHGVTEWAESFWKYCLDVAPCVFEESSNKVIERKKKLAAEMCEARKEYLEQTNAVGKRLIEHYFMTLETTEIDSRIEGAFGIALFGLTIFAEIIYWASCSITGRMALRGLSEAYITFKYLLKKEEVEPRIWEDYRGYGTGQLKLIYLKMKEMGKEAGCFDVDEIDRFANEDRSVDFVPINLGHWDSTNLRKISADVGLKQIYDKYYNYNSGFIHASWGAVRESVFHKCLNPLHRFHNVPALGLPLMPSVTADALEITNCILKCLSQAYPKYSYRLKKVKTPVKTSVSSTNQEPEFKKT